ncbi:MAG: histidine kinase [Bacteroidota bacterium]
MTKQKLYWLCQVLGWGIWGFFQVFLWTVTERFDPDQILGVLLQVAFYIISTHYFRNLILRFQWLDLKLSSLIPRLLIFTLILSGINYFYLLGIKYLANGVTKVDLMVITLAVNMLGYWALYFMWTVFYFIFYYVERYNKSLKVEAEAMEAELNNLKAQLNPHFIFNALNSIRALVDENPSKSKESITQLSHILRNSLVSNRKKLIPFSEELKTVLDYLALESIRYEERLSTHFDIDHRSGEFLIPPLMLQTLVENGIKHGISNAKDGGIISIATTVRKKHLTLEIRNTGQLFDEKSDTEGLGIRNTKKRLDLLYGYEASFKLLNENSKTVLTKISIPKT